MNYLVTEFCGLGNLIMALPSLKNLSDLNNKKSLTIVGNNQYGGLNIAKNIKYLDYIVNTKESNLIKIKFYWNLVLGKYDVLIIFSQSSPNNFFLFLAYLFVRKKIIQPHYFKKLSNPLLRIFFNIILEMRKKFDKNFLISKVKEIYEDTHEIQANFNLIKTLFVEGSNYKIQKPEFNYKYDEKILGKFNLKKNNYTILQTVASSGNISPKNWKLGHNLELINKFNLAQINLVLIGDKVKKLHGLSNEQPVNINDYIANLKFVKNLMGKTNINELMNLLYFSKGIICLDSGIMHIGDAMNKKLIALFGPTDMRKNDVKGKNSKIMSINLNCSPCLKGWSFPGSVALNEKQAAERCGFNFECMNSITPSDVFKNSINFFKLEENK